MITAQYSQGVRTVNPRIKTTDHPHWWGGARSVNPETLKAFCEREKRVLSSDMATIFNEDIAKRLISLAKACAKKVDQYPRLAMVSDPIIGCEFPPHHKAFLDIIRDFFAKIPSARVAEVLEVINGVLLEPKYEGLHGARHKTEILFLMECFYGIQSQLPLQEKKPFVRTTNTRANTRKDILTESTGGPAFHPSMIFRSQSSFFVIGKDASGNQVYEHSPHTTRV